jgi:predicted O-linked N-acetylglucosamine transferase (SPINDLY family)
MPDQNSNPSQSSSYTAIEAALKIHRNGNLRDAEAVYRRVLETEPNNPDALHLLGLIESQSGRRQNGLELIRRAIALNPSAADYHDNLGLICTEAKLTDEAIAAHHRAVTLNPRHRQAHYNLANLLFNKGQMNEAIALYRQAIANRPDHADAHQNLGTALNRVGQIDQAEASLRTALSLRKDSAEAHNNLGVVLAGKMKLDAAIAQYHEALKLKPNFVQALSNLGAALRLKGQFKEAIDALQQALRLNPNMAEALNNLGIALKETLRLDEAMVAYQRCLAVAPAMRDARNNLGNVYKDCGEIEEAVACYAQSLAIGPVEPNIQSNMIYTLQFHPGYDDESLYREQRRFNEVHALPLKNSIRPHERPPASESEPRLRIGYVSPYFYGQAESFFVEPLFAAHDHKQFEIHCYASTIRPDAMTTRLKSFADVWHDVLGWKDDAVAEQIRNDRIDVLIDLAMHMSFNRLITFARKPAPVQVAWLAYPGGTGLDTMDYRITDAYMDPPELETPYYREESIRLADCWACYSSLSDLLPAPKRQDGPIRFGSINNPCKINEPLLRLWARLLREVPDARLLIQSMYEGHRAKIRSTFQSMGIAPERLEFVGRKLRAEYLRIYDAVDIGLDPLPYNGITTTCDALWMGVPVVTLAGHTASGRAGVSILSTIGLPELVARTEDEFIRIAAGLAGDRARLADLRSTLRQRTTQSPLMDAPGFARKMEAAYREMWQRWRDGKSPSRNS